jgi:hypothetical protein
MLLETQVTVANLERQVQAQAAAAKVRRTLSAYVSFAVHAIFK